MNKRFHVRERSFLNLSPEMRAYVIAIVEDTREAHPCCDSFRYGGEIKFELASCYDEINLHFDLANAEERANSLHKATRLAEIVNAFRDAIEAEVRAIEERTAVQQHARAASAVH